LVGSTTGTEFDSIDLPREVRAGIRDAGFTHCTPIQDKVLPLALAGRDVAAQAQTGTGKTAVFLITLFTKLLASARPARPGAPRALIIAPTRELAVQIFNDAKLLGGHTGFAIHAVYGGVNYRKQREILEQSVDVVIGTPGRLIDYFKQRVYTLRRAEVLVVDEADRMFDMGFIRDLRFLLRRLPPFSQRQSMLFSATLSYQVLELAYEHMNDPVHVSASAERITADKIEHVIYHVGRQEKPSLLIGLLRREASSRVLIFTNMRRTAQRLGEILQANGISAAPITGDMEQRQRLRILDSFKAGELPVLVATDVASRGLHIEAVTHVINYDLPQDPEDYVHRTGRTARAGATGEAVSLVSEEDVDALEPIERLIGFKLAFVIPDDSVLAPVVHLGKRRSREERPKPRDRVARSNEGRRRTRDPRPERPQAHHQAQHAHTAQGSPGGAPQSERRSHGPSDPPPTRRRRRRRRQASAPTPTGRS
jgi:ATP-dependent RNA helicase RhlB